MCRNRFFEISMLMEASLLVESCKTFHLLFLSQVASSSDSLVLVLSYLRFAGGVREREATQCESCVKQKMKESGILRK